MSDPAPLTISETALKTVSIIGAPSFLRSGSLGSLAEISCEHQLPSFYQLFQPLNACGYRDDKLPGRSTPFGPISVEREPQVSRSLFR